MKQMRCRGFALAFAFLSISIVTAAFAAEQTPPPLDMTVPPMPSIDPALPTLWIIGDSTANNKTKGREGWADPFKAYFDTARINVVNRARGGRSSRTFLTHGLWDLVMERLKAGDYVLIQFGHNDAGALNDTSRARGTLHGLGEETEEIDNLLTKKHELVHTYGWYMKRYVEDAKSKGAHPIVLGLTVRNIWKDGKVERGPGQYGDWAREVAILEKIPFVPLSDLIAEKYEKRGQEAVKKFFPRDHTHTSPQGADFTARMVVRGLSQLPDSQLVKYFSAKGRKLVEKRNERGAPR